MSDSEQIRQQIQRAVAEARARAYERAMEGGAPKGSLKLKTNKTQRRFAKGGNLYNRGQDREAYKSFRKANKGNTKFALKRLNDRSGKRGVYETSPIQYNPKYRSYVAYVYGSDNKARLMQSDRPKGVASRKFRGTPISAARKVASALNRNVHGKNYVLDGSAQAYEHAVSAIKVERGMVRVLLVEVTQGIRKRRNLNRAAPRLVRQVGNPLAAYYTYSYWVGVEDISPVEANGVVRSTKSIAWRTTKAGNNLDAAKREHAKKSAAALERYHNNPNFKAYRRH